MQVRIISLILLSLLILAACGGEESQQDVQKQVAAIKARPVPPIAPLPPVRPMQKAVYQAGNLPDPFQPAKKITAQDFNRPDLNRKKEPLETFSLDSLQMVGTIKKAGQFWALVKAPDGNIYPVAVGQYMGQNYGLVINITMDAVQIEEKVQISGAWQKRKTQLLLKQ